MKLQMQWVTLGTFFVLGIGYVFGSLPKCPEVDFNYQKRIQYENGSVSLVNQTIQFPLTFSNNTAIMPQLCVNEKDGLQVRRRCLANNTWETLDNIICRPTRKLSEDLFNMDLELNPIISDRSGGMKYDIAIHNITDMIMGLMGPLEDHEVISLANIIKVVTESSDVNLDVSTDIISMYNHLMDKSSEILKLAILQNATRNLLQNFERFTNKLEPPHCDGTASNYTIRVLDMRKDAGLLLLIGEEISLLHLNPECKNYTGVAIYNGQGPDRRHCKHHGYWYRLLRPDQNLLELKQENNLIAATYLTNDLWKALKESKAKYLVFKIYTNNAFFFADSTQEKRKVTPISNVLSLNVIGVDDSVLRNLPHNLTFLLRHKKESVINVKYDYCGYWDHGKWERKGVYTSPSSTDLLAICVTSHLTSFAFLMGGSCKQTRNCSTDEILLNTITTVGCWFSIVGIVGIWLTSLFCKRWRARPSAKMLFHLSIAMAILYGLLLLLDLNETLMHFQFEQGSVSCTIVGVIFQYAVLLLFSWMLLIGYLQYQRHVRLIMARSERTVTKVIAIAWILPLVPTLLLVSIDHRSYRLLPYASDKSVCYPSGNGFTFAVLIPIGLVLISNSYFFGRIFFRISNMSNRNVYQVWMQMRLFLLLFFLLGLTWIFGLGTYFELGYVFNYLLCSTATIQGFVLFIFFVLLNKISRDFWIQFILRRPLNTERDL